MSFFSRRGPSARLEDSYDVDSIRELYKSRPRAYLDNAAAPLLLSTIPHKAADLLCSQVLVNPHSPGSLGSETQNLIQGVRRQVLDLVNADPVRYDVVFCANATAGLKLICEGYLATRHFAYLVDSHTSLMGMRNLALSYSVFENAKDLEKLGPRSVIAWPLQSNFDGRRHPGKEFADQIRQQGSLSLLDIASYAATSMPDFSEIEPDFAVMSFYKIFGMPDLGALLIRKSPETAQFWADKKYFGGGTVAAVTPTSSFMVRPTQITDVLEDGTLPMHNIMILKVAIDEFRLAFGSFDAISNHTKTMADYCRHRLEKISGVTIMGDYGSPIVTFVPPIGHNEFVTAAGLADVHVRGGTLCNIGGFMRATNVQDSEIIDNHRDFGKKCNDKISFIRGKATGVVRASMGPYTSKADIDALLDVVIELSSAKLLRSNEARFEPATVEDLIIYPIKSCSGLSLKQSLISDAGLHYDRMFCVVDLASKNVLSLKKHRVMTFIKPLISGSSLVVSYEPTSSAPRSIVIPLNESEWLTKEKNQELVLYSESRVVDFFTKIIGIPCTLAKHEAQEKDLQSLSSRDLSTFSNSSPLLVVTTTSAKVLHTDFHVFRPNIVLKTSKPWIEDEWRGIHHPTSSLSMLGKCRRCNMVCVTNTGQTDISPYMQLCRNRKIDGKLYFGQHAAIENMADLSIWTVGDTVQPF